MMQIMQNLEGNFQIKLYKIGLRVTNYEYVYRLYGKVHDAHKNSTYLIL